MPFLYGKFGAIPPPSLTTALGPGYIRMPEWVDLPVLTLALASLWRMGKLPSLRFVLLFWVILWEARYLGVAPVMWLMNAMPGIGTADSTRYSGTAVGFAIFALAAFGFDDYQRLPIISRARLGAILLSLAVIVIAAIAPVLGFIRSWYILKPHGMLFAAGASGFAALVLVFLCTALRRAQHREALAALLLAAPLFTFILPQFAGVRGGHIDMAPIRYLQSHIGTSRMISLGPLDTNFPDRYRIASINYVALPVPSLWTNYISTDLFPQSDLTVYQGSQIGQTEAFRERLPAYEAIAVRYVVASPDIYNFWSQQLHAVDANQRNFPLILTPRGGDLTGTIAVSLPFQSVSAMSVVVGTYFGEAHGPVLATLCAAGACTEATEDTSTAIDDAPMTFTFPTPLNVPAGNTLTYRFSHPAGTKVAIWMAPGANGAEEPTLTFIAPPQGPVPSLVFHDGTASIFELPQAAPYAETTDTDCKVDIVNRQHIRTSCPAPTVLTRRELFFPGWSAAAGGAPVAISQAGLFQTVAVPAGMADIKFSYAPPGIKLACTLALLALALWLGLALRARQ